MDRDKWIELLQRSAEQHGWIVFAVALLTNHYRLFLQTPEPNLSKGMHHLNGVWSGLGLGCVRRPDSADGQEP